MDKLDEIFNGLLELVENEDKRVNNLRISDRCKFDGNKGIAKEHH